MTYVLKPNGLWAIPDSYDFLWEQIHALGADATHGAMLMHNFIAHHHQSGNIAKPDPSYEPPSYLKEGES